MAATFIFSGCASSHSCESATNSAENQKIARVKVLSAADNSLIKTIEDESVLNEFAKKTALDDSKSNHETSDRIDLSKYKANYIFVIYKKSAVVGSNDFEKIYDLTTYENTNNIKLQISPNSIKNIKISDDLLSNNFETSADVIEYLKSLI